MTLTDTAGGTAYYGGANPGSAEGDSSTIQLAAGTTYGQIPTSGGVEARLGGASGGNGFFNKSAFTNPIVIGADGLATAFGNAGLGIIRGPDQVNFDLSIITNTHLTERQSLQFRTEFLNIANHPVFGNPTLARNNTLFGVINTTVGNPRLIQFALKWNF